MLLVSCQWVVLSLLRAKEGVFGIVEGLSRDYKFSLRALSNRQKGILQNIAAVDQTYCVAEKSMTDKMF